MKMQSRGFSSLLLLVMIGIIAVAGAAFVYSEKHNAAIKSALIASSTEESAVHDTIGGVKATAISSNVKSSAQGQVSASSNSAQITLPTINAPQGWVRSSGALGPGEYLMYSSSEKDSAGALANIQAIVTKDNPNAKSPTKPSVAAKYDSTFKNILESKTTVSGSPADLYEYELANTHFKVIYVVKDGYEYVISGQYKIGSGEKYAEAIDTSLTSVILP